MPKYEELNKTLDQKLSRVKESEVELCKEFLLGFSPLKSVTRNKTSYGYKHDVERWVNRVKGTHHYIGQASFTQAAREMGFVCESQGDSSPNHYFNISSRDIDRRAKEYSSIRF